MAEDPNDVGGETLTEAPVVCPRCKGAKREPPTELLSGNGCVLCHGLGTCDPVTATRYVESARCTNCGGTGFTQDAGVWCPKCEGRGSFA